MKPGSDDVNIGRRFFVSCPWWIWNLIFITELLGAENWFNALASVIMIALGYSWRYPGFVRK